MAPDVLLSLLTLVVAIIGTLLKDPPKWAKAALISLAVLSTGASIVKAAGDESDKSFMKLSLTSLLTPSTAIYQKFYDLVEQSGKQRGLSANFDCHHHDVGMTCFLANKGGDRHATLVLNKADIAQLYVDQLSAAVSDPKKAGVVMRFVFWLHSIFVPENHTDIIAASFDEPAAPGDFEEVFLDKVGILGYGVFFNMFGRWPSDYNYDEKLGVRFIIDKDGRPETMGLSPSELSKTHGGAASVVFHDLEGRLREKFAALR